VPKATSTGLTKLESNPTPPLPQFAALNEEQLRAFKAELTGPTYLRGYWAMPNATEKEFAAHYEGLPMRDLHAMAFDLKESVPKIYEGKEVHVNGQIFTRKEAKAIIPERTWLLRELEAKLASHVASQPNRRSSDQWKAEVLAYTKEGVQFGLRRAEALLRAERQRLGRPIMMMT